MLTIPFFDSVNLFKMNDNVQIVHRFVGKYLSCNITDFGRNICEMNCNFKSEFCEYLLCTLHIQLCVCNNHCSCCCYLLIRMSSSDMEFVQCNPKTCMSFFIVIHPLAFLKDQHLCVLNFGFFSIHISEISIQASQFSTSLKFVTPDRRFHRSLIL